MKCREGAAGRSDSDVALRGEGVDRKIEVFGNWNFSVGRPPRGGRGLKSPLYGPNAHLKMVALRGEGVD